MAPTTHSNDVWINNDTGNNMKQAFSIDNAEDPCKMVRISSEIIYFLNCIFKETDTCDDITEICIPDLATIFYECIENTCTPDMCTGLGETCQTNIDICQNTEVERSVEVFHGEK